MIKDESGGKGEPIQHLIIIKVIKVFSMNYSAFFSGTYLHRFSQNEITAAAQIVTKPSIHQTSGCKLCSKFM